jgi:hypothetical protein
MTSPWAAGERYVRMEMDLMRAMVETLDMAVKCGVLAVPVRPWRAVQLLLPQYGKGGCLLWLHYVEKAARDTHTKAALIGMVKP